MRKIILTVISLTLVLCLFSCVTAPPVSTETAEQQTTAERKTTEEPKTTQGWTVRETTIDGRPVKIYEGGKMFVSEITLPADGETIEYDPPLLLFENDAAKLVVSSASRDGKKLTFYSTKTDKCFASLSIDICTSEREVFAGLNAEEKEDGKLEYVTYLYERVDDYDSRIKSYQAWLREDGKQYDGSKDWYSVSTGRLFEN